MHARTYLAALLLLLKLLHCVLHTQRYGRALEIELLKRHPYGLQKV